MKTANGSATRAFVLIVSMLPVAGVAEEGKDPANRDEDVSLSEISVDYYQDEANRWVYEYSIRSPEGNKGRISDFAIRLRCDVEFGNRGLVPAPVVDDPSSSGPRNEAKITPTAIRADSDQVYRYGIGAKNIAWWAVKMPPGEEVENLKLISVAEPGLREYELRPYLDTAGYDYSDWPDKDLPWVEDFTVTGVIAGPGCPGEVPPTEEPSFAGTTPGSESGKVNHLLTYKEPLKNRLHLDEGESARITIMYGQELDPNTFTAEPGWTKRHFSPEPGTEETVEIPMKEDHLRLFLEGRGKRAEERPEGKKDAPPEHARKDRDEFEFRLPESKADREKGR